MMNLGVTTAQVQTQSLIITPQLRQSIEILQLSSVDLLKFLEERALENPALEVDDELPYLSSAPFRGARQHEAYDNWIESVPRRSETLESYLLEQLMYQRINGRVKKIAEYMIGNISPSGYMEVSVDEIAAALRASREEAERALELIQSFDPSGVGARDLRECLLLQLPKLKKPIHPLAKPVIESYLTDVGAGKIKQVAKELAVHPREVQCAVEEIRLYLHPKPGIAFAEEESQFIIPDVFVRKAGGHYKLSLNDSLFPKVSIQKQYAQSVESALTGDEGFVRYMQEHIQSAQWVKRSVDKRKKTILRVSEAIMRNQASFLDYGAEQLAPLNLKDIAAELDMHESTISRTAHGKYIQTPHGVYELKFFFSGGLSQGGSHAVSSLSVKKRIAAEIDRENPSRPISDAQICAVLNREHIEISRRTVAKYREELRIPASSKRKRF